MFIMGIHVLNELGDIMGHLDLNTSFLVKYHSLITVGFKLEKSSTHQEFLGL